MAWGRRIKEKEKGKARELGSRWRQMEKCMERCKVRSMERHRKRKRPSTHEKAKVVLGNRTGKVKELEMRAQRNQQVPVSSVSANMCGCASTMLVCGGVIGGTICFYFSSS